MLMRIIPVSQAILFLAVLLQGLPGLTIPSFRSDNLNEWRVFSSTDIVNWQDHGSPMNLATFAWISARAWAGHVVQRNSRFYWYIPMRRRGRRMAIGVGVSDSPIGPFRDAIGRPLVENDEIDPHVFIDDDGQAYLY